MDQVATQMGDIVGDVDSSYSSFILPIVISAAFLLLRYLDLRYIQKKEIITRDMIREGALLFLAVMVGSYIVSEFVPAVNIVKKTPQVFTAEPEF